MYYVHQTYDLSFMELLYCTGT